MLPVQQTIEIYPPELHLHIGMIVFPGMDQMDVAGPFAVLARLPNSSIELLWKTTEPVRDQRGLAFIPDATFATAKPIDVLVVPGGWGQEDLMDDDVVLSFIRQQAERAKCVFFICTGSLVCGAAGLLKGRQATTHWRSFHLLKYFGVTPIQRRVVIDGKLVSAAGLTAGIDGALQVAALLRGDDAARAIQLDIEYAPQPPFDCGSPEKAPAAIRAKVEQATEKLMAQRLATARRVAARLHVTVKD